MVKRTGLGKGLDALIPSGQTTISSSEGGGVAQVAVDLIQRNPRQPRASERSSSSPIRSRSGSSMRRPFSRRCARRCIA